MVKLLEVVIEGFGSIGNNLTFPLNLKGITLIKGNNGVGKTTVFNALTWCLYSANLKGIISGRIPTFPMYRGNNFRGTRVAVFLEKDNITYCVVRHIKFKGATYGLKGSNTLMLFKDANKADLDNLHASRCNMVTNELFKRDQQGYINTLMGMDYKIFINSILFGQKMSRLISSSGVEKRKLLEQIFDLFWVSQAKEKAKETLAEVTIDLVTYKGEIKTQKAKLELFEGQLEKVLQMASDFMVTKEKSIARKTQVKQKLEQDLSVTKSRYDYLVEVIKTNKVKQNHLQRLVNDFDDTTLVSIRAKITTIKLGLSKLLDNVEKAEAKVININNLEREKSMLFKQISYDLYTREHELKASIKQSEKAISNIEKYCYACGKEIEPKDIKHVEEKLKLSLSGSKDKLRVLQSDTTLELIDQELQCIVNKKKPLLQNVVGHSDKIKEVKEKLDKWVHFEGESSKGIISLKTDLKLITGSIKNVKLAMSNTKLNISKLQGYIQDAINDLKETKLMCAPDLKIRPLNKKIKACQDKLKLTSKLIEGALQKQLAYEFWVKKGFASTGLSSYIFSAMIDELNMHVHKWAEKVGFNIEMGIDLEKSSKPFYTKVMFKGGQIANYNELSGGEQQLIDICMAFGVHEMVSKQLPILILDEVFESLDPNNIYKVFDFARVKVEEGKGVYIITHLKDLDCQYAKTIDIGKVNHLTQIQWV